MSCRCFFIAGEFIDTHPLCSEHGRKEKNSELTALLRRIEMLEKKVEMFQKKS